MTNTQKRLLLGAQSQKELKKTLDNDLTHLVEERPGESFVSQG